MTLDAFKGVDRTFALLLGALLLLAVAVLTFNLPAIFGNPRTIIVSGDATVLLSPDRIDVAASVTTSAPTSGEALDKNNERVAAVLAGLKADGIPSKDVRTSGFSISPQHPRDQNARENEMITTGYIVTNSIIVSLKAEGASGKIVDRLVRLGATAIDRVNFYAENTADAQNTAREKAAENARLRAERIVKALGNRLGRTLKIEQTELQASTFGLIGNNAAGWRAENSATLQLAAPQTQAVTAMLAVTFEIE